MSVLLVQPTVNFERTYPLGLAYLAGHLLRHGVEVHGVDLRLVGRQGLADALDRHRPELIGVSTYSGNLASALDALDLAKERCPEATLVMGGPHATLATGAEALVDRCDFLVRGDGEAPLLALANGETEGPGLARPGQPEFDDEQIHVHADLAELDFPDRTVFPLEAYYQDALKRGRWTAMITSRGCVRDCGYCTARRLSRGSFRKRQPEAVVEELRQLRRDHQLHGVQFEDDNLFVDRAWAESLFEALARDGGRTPIQFPNGVDPMQLDGKLIALMKRAGVESISLGIESLDEQNRAALRRPMDNEHIRQVIAHCHDQDVRVAGFFIIGLPQDTVLRVLNMYRRIRALGLDLAHVSALQEDVPGLTIEAPSSSAKRRQTMLLLQRAFYPYYYTHFDKLKAMLARGDLSLAHVTKILVRFVNWTVR